MKRGLRPVRTWQASLAGELRKQRVDPSGHLRLITPVPRVLLRHGGRREAACVLGQPSAEGSVIAGMAQLHRIAHLTYRRDVALRGSVVERARAEQPHWPAG